MTETMDTDKQLYVSMVADMTDYQRLLCLLAVVNGKPLNEAIDLALSYK